MWIAFLFPLSFSASFVRSSVGFFGLSKHTHGFHPFSLPISRWRKSQYGNFPDILLVGPCSSISTFCLFRPRKLFVSCYCVCFLSSTYLHVANLAYVLPYSSVGFFGLNKFSSLPLSRWRKSVGRALYFVGQYGHPPLCPERIFKTTQVQGDS